MPDFKSIEEFKQAILLAKENGAKGITFFDGPAIADEYLKAIKEVKESLKE
jgi:sugar phosphate isomerase/epimerase